MVKPPAWGLQNVDGRLAIRLPYGVSGDAIAFYRARGLTVSPRGGWAFWPNMPEYREAENNGKLALRFDVPCPHLTADRLCELHGTDQQPRVCCDFPTIYTDLASVAEVCTFLIEETEDAADL